MSALTAPRVIFASALKGMLRTKRMFRSGIPFASARSRAASSLRAAKRANRDRARDIADSGSPGSRSSASRATGTGRPSSAANSSSVTALTSASR